MRFCGTFRVSIITNVWFFRYPRIQEESGRQGMGSHATRRGRLHSPCHQVPHQLGRRMCSYEYCWAGPARVIGFLFSLASLSLPFTCIHIPYSSQTLPHALSLGSPLTYALDPVGGLDLVALHFSSTCGTPLFLPFLCPLIPSFLFYPLPSPPLCLHLSYLSLSCSV